MTTSAAPSASITALIASQQVRRELMVELIIAAKYFCFLPLSGGENRKLLTRWPLALAFFFVIKEHLALSLCVRGVPGLARFFDGHPIRPIRVIRIPLTFPSTW